MGQNLLSEFNTYYGVDKLNHGLVTFIRNMPANIGAPASLDDAQNIFEQLDVRASVFKRFIASVFGN